MNEEKPFSMERDAFNNVVPVGSDFDVINSPQTIDTTVVEIDVSWRTAEIMIMPDWEDLKVGTDALFADGYDLVASWSKEAFWVASRTSIFVATVSWSCSVYFRKVIV